MTSNEEQKKAILPFLQRADEIGKVEPKVAYYCRLYAIQQGLSLENRSPVIDGVLKALLNKLESEKKTISLEDGDSQYCENFAITVFSRADKVDRAGRADKNTAMTFYAASIFFEILNQFKNEGLENDLIEMQRYAAWKAADIRKALREGRTPTPGASGDDAPSASTLTPSGDMGAPSSTPYPQSGANMPPAASIDAANLPAVNNGSIGIVTRFSAGARVWFDNNGVPVRGTVAKPHAAGEGSEYMVALSDRIVTAPEASLAPDLEAGDTALFEPQPGEAAEVTIASADASVWPPSYNVALQNGAHMPAPYMQLMLLQQTSRRQSLDHQEAHVTAKANASQPSGDASSAQAYPTVPFPPTAPGASPYSNAGDSQAKYSSRSDLSQALLFNTAALESNLAAAQQGGAIDSSEVEESESTDASLGTYQANIAPKPNRNAIPPGSASGPPQAHQPQPPSQQAIQLQPQQVLAPSVEIPQAAPGFQPALSAISEAQKQAKYAASSLGFEDVSTAIKQLTDALKLLTQPGTASNAKRR